MKSETINRLNEIIKKLSQNKKVAAIFLFGSQVNGRAREHSDVDIAVLIKNSNNKDLDFIAKFRNDLFDTHPFHKLPLEIQFRVIRDGKMLFLRDKKSFRLIWVKTIRDYFDFQPFINKFYRRVIANV